jgi:hypothetical protein
MPTTNLSRVLPLAVFTLSALLSSCGSEEPKEKTPDIAMVRGMEMDEMVKRGEYLVKAGSCNDCHSPKKFDANGMHIDTDRLLSGSPSENPTKPFPASALEPGNWIQMSPDVNSFVGPWGISYAANLTPDSATGIGTWSKEMFIKAIRTGKHMGLENGRPIMPPMPWKEISNYTDEDLESIFHFLKSLPPINNRVKEYVSPPEAAKLAQ